jgi:hypothetical protein
MRFLLLFAAVLAQQHPYKLPKPLIVEVLRDVT